MAKTICRACAAGPSNYGEDCQDWHIELFARSDRGELFPRDCPVGSIVTAYVAADYSGTRYMIVEGPREETDELARNRETQWEVRLISLPPADEPVELGTLAEGDFCQPLPEERRAAGMSVAWDGLLRVTGYRRDDLCQLELVSTGAKTEIFSHRKVYRRPAPTAQPTEKRPPCDACGEECAPKINYSVDGVKVALCKDCYYQRDANDVTNNVRARRAKTSGSEKAVTQKDATAEQRSGNAAALQPEELRWPNTAPDRIPARRAKTSSSSGKMSMSKKEWEQANEAQASKEDLLREAGLAARREREARDREIAVCLPSARHVSQGVAGSEARRQEVHPPNREAARWPNTTPDRIPALEAILAAQVAAGGVDTEYTRGRIVAREVALRELDRPSRPTKERVHPGSLERLDVRNIQPGPLLHRSELTLEQKALWRRR